MSQTGGIILIVDDDEIVRDTLEGLLLTQGCQLAFASTGAEALVKAAELAPDLILLDVMMPEMDGFEVCRHLRADPLRGEVPILMVTALDDRESRLQGIKAGADDFITKPFDATELQARVHTIIRLNRYRRITAERSKFEWVVEQAEDGYLTLNEAGYIQYINSRAALYLGLPPDGSPFNAEKFLELVQKQYQCEPEWVWASWSSLAVNQSPCYLVRPESATDEAFWLQVELLEMPARPLERYLVRLRDITADYRTQQIMWSFQSHVNHKLRTPLTKLVGFLKILKDERAGLTDKDSRELLGIVDRSATQLNQEIQTILDYLEALSLTKPGEWFHLAEISLVVTNISNELGLKPANVTYEGFENLSEALVSISRQNIELILWELFENAKKFHPSHTPTLDINVAATSAGVRLQIYDDGQTLAPHQLVKMWTPYYQAEKNFTGQIAGMGLGLSIVASLIWSVGGQCRAYNRDDLPGLIFELELLLV